MAMAHSVEGRYPFLDHRVVEVAGEASPEPQDEGSGSQKHLLKRAAGSPILSGDVTNSRIGRLTGGFTGPGSEYVDDMLSPNWIWRDGIFRPAGGPVAGAETPKRARPSTGHSMALMAILSAEVLLDQALYPRPHLRRRAAARRACPAMITLSGPMSTGTIWSTIANTSRNWMDVNVWLRYCSGLAERKCEIRRRVVDCPCGWAETGES